MNYAKVVLNLKERLIPERHQSSQKSRLSLTPSIPPSLAEGFSLEVVLPFIEEREVESGRTILSCPIQEGRGICSSGVGELIGDPNPVGTEGFSNGWMVDKDRGDAQHVIDIQDDLGVTFKEDGEATIQRCMKMEQRDRKLKSDWVLGNGDQ
jgi:hypothetical protein